MKAILCFGASIVWGRGDNSFGGWVGHLKKHFEAQDYYNLVYNLGIPGDTSTGLLERLRGKCHVRTKKKRPEDKFLILVGMGHNDLKFVGKQNESNTPPELFRENILKIIKIAKKYSSKIIFVGLTPVNEKLTTPYETTTLFNKQIEQYNQIIKGCCKDKVLFVDFFEEWVNSDYVDWLGDGLHPNKKGYQLMFEKIQEFI